MSGGREQGGVEDALEKVVELARTELDVRRHRRQEHVGTAVHGHEYRQLREVADRLDHYAQRVRRAHDEEMPGGWRDHGSPPGRPEHRG